MGSSGQMSPYDAFMSTLSKLMKKGSINALVPLSPVLVSYGCLNKLPQTRRLKTTKTYSLPVLEARSPRSRRAMLLIKPGKEDLSLPLAYGGGWQSLAFLSL